MGYFVPLIAIWRLLINTTESLTGEKGGALTEGFQNFLILSYTALGIGLALFAISLLQHKRRGGRK